MTQRRCYQWHLRERTLSLGTQTRVMGIINVTPDSFSGDGHFKGNTQTGSALRLAKKMLADGADIIDIGGVSTRPGALSVPGIEECRRVIPLVEALASLKSDVIISVDTSKTAVVKDVLKAGAHLINVVQSHSITGGFLKAVRHYDTGIVLMHMRGTPRTMQQMTNYKRFFPELLRELQQTVKFVLDSGIDRNRIVIDPGIGFAKTAVQNFLLIKELHRFKPFKLPVLIGPSRKSFIGSVLNVGPSERLFGTIAALVASVLNGAHIVRVHDVLEAKQAILIADTILTGGE